MKKPTIQVLVAIYENADARNWLTMRGCQLSPTHLGNLEVVFDSDIVKTEFCLKFGHYVDQQPDLDGQC